MFFLPITPKVVGSSPASGQQRGVAQLGRALALGARCRRFKSCHLDQSSPCGGNYMSVSKLHSHTPLGTASEPSRELLNAFGEMCKAKGGEPARNLPSLHLVRENRFILLRGRKVSRSKKRTGDEVANSRRTCSSSLMAEHQISNLIVRVRSSSGAPYAGVPE